LVAKGQGIRSINSSDIRIALDEALSLLGQEGRTAIIEYIGREYSISVRPNDETFLSREEVEYALRSFFGADSIAESILQLFDKCLKDLTYRSYRSE
jgi:hypothetical protein